MYIEYLTGKTCLSGLQRVLVYIGAPSQARGRNSDYPCITQDEENDPMISREIRPSTANGMRYTSLSSVTLFASQEVRALRLRARDSWDLRETLSADRKEVRRPMRVIKGVTKQM